MTENLVWVTNNGSETWEQYWLRTSAFADCFVIGKPQATELHNVYAMQSMGWVGIYIPESRLAAWREQYGGEA